MEPSMVGCLAFLRELEGHASRTAAGSSRPDHALGCASCARRLEFAMALASPLKQRPSLPAELASPRFFEQIHEQIVQQFEVADPAGALRAALRGEAVGQEIPRPNLPWPLQATEPVIEESLRSPSLPGSAPALLWPRVRQHVGALGARAVRSPRTTVRRVGAVAASVALFAVIGWKFGQEQGTSANIPIVFVTAAELRPSQLTLLHPTAVLRDGPVEIR